MVVFVLSGLWHGAAPTFAIWGALNGLYVVASQLAPRSRATAHSIGASLLRGVVTFHLVLVTWVFFRAPSLPEAWTILSRTALAAPALPELLRVRLGDPQILLSWALIGLLLAVEVIDERRSIWDRLRVHPVAVRWAVYYALLSGIVVLGTWNMRQFVYMQF
jgi:hypothetical protein